MPTIAIVGAGPGLGLSIAKVFGAHDFSVALVSRRQSTLDALVAELRTRDIDATGFGADVMDRTSLVQAFKNIVSRYGQVDVMEFSPAPHTPQSGMALVGPLDVSVANVQPQLDFYVHGAITATGQVLPEMIERGSGTLLYTTGASSVAPAQQMGNVGIAGAALRNWVLNLHDALADKGVYAAHVPLSVWIGQGGPETQPDAIAPLYWDLHERGEGPEHLYSAEAAAGRSAPDEV